MKKILFVEDEQIDARIVSKALEGTGFLKHLEHVITGEEALAILHDKSRPKPEAMLLDLMLPGIKGWEVAHIMKKDPELAHIPIIILTNTQKEEYDLQKEYDKEVYKYIRKRLNYPAFASELLESLYSLNIAGIKKTRENQTSLF